MTNNRRLLVMLLIIIVCLLVVIAILKITSQKVVCNKPYIIVGTSCCLDQNDNSICDKDENIPVQTINVPETSTISISTTTIQQQIISNAIVSKVTDGDTIKLQTGETVRLLGINTPEMGQKYYTESTNRLKELIEGKEVTLVKDVEDRETSGGRRLLRHIFINNENVGIKLIMEGYATVYIIPPNVKYEKELKDAWSDCLSKKINLCKQAEGGCDNRCIGISLSNFKWNAEGDDCNNLNGEYVTFVNNCSYSCDLTNWTVKDESSRNPYVFPSFVLDNGTTVTLYTGCGTNTKAQLYWCSSGYSCNAIWNNEGGDTLYLRNSNGELVLDYSYPGFQ